MMETQNNIRAEYNLLYDQYKAKEKEYNSLHRKAKYMKQVTLFNMRAELSKLERAMYKK